MQYPRTVQNAEHGILDSTGSGPRVYGELAFKRRLAVQTARGNGFANGNSQGRLAEVLGRPLSPRVCCPIALDAREPRYSSF